MIVLYFFNKVLLGFYFEKSKFFFVAFVFSCAAIVYFIL